MGSNPTLSANCNIQANDYIGLRLPLISDYQFSGFLCRPLPAPVLGNSRNKSSKPVVARAVRGIYPGTGPCHHASSVDYNAAMYIIKRMPDFDRWLAGLRDPQTRVRLLRRLEKAQRGLLGDIAAVGDGVFEMREFFGPGWRMYYIQQGTRLIVMLGGGDKTSQAADIVAAKTLAANLGE